jgi:hypothetical protein
VVGAVCGPILEERFYPDTPLPPPLTAPFIVANYNSLFAISSSFPEHIITPLTKLLTAPIYEVLIYFDICYIENKSSTLYGRENVSNQWIIRSGA